MGKKNYIRDGLTSKLTSLFARIFFIILFFCFTSFTTLHSEIVKEVKVSGNKRISKETLMVFGDIKINQNYEADDVNLIIKKLFDSNFFSHIKIELTNGILNIEVKENPIINLIVFNGIKAEKYRSRVTELIEMKEKTPFIRNSIKKDIAAIKGFYRALGYYFVKIEAEIEELSKNRINLVYDITPGEKAKITKIYFLGNKVLRTKRLRDIITSEESKFWKVLSKNVYLNADRIELDKRLLENYYKNKGYYEVLISSSNVEYIEDEGFVLTFSIDAGKRYRFGKIFANVSESLDKSEFFSLDSEFKKVAGEYYSRKKLGDILEKIDTLTERKELQFINHKIIETLDGDKVVVQIDISEGKKTYIERIDIMGNNVTNESVIRGEMIVDEGDPYSSLLVNKSINKIQGRNIFRTVKHKVLSGSKTDMSVIEIEVEEQPTGEVAAGAGVGTEGTTFNFFIRENNWLGRGVRLKTSLDLTEESVRGGIDIVNPNYNYTGNSVSTSFNSSQTDRLTTSGYKSTNTTFGLATSFEQYENIFIAPGISAGYESIETDGTASNSIKKMEGDYSSLNFNYGIIYDKRDRTFQPTDGFRSKFSQKLPIYADSPSLMNAFDYSHYHSFSEDVVGSFKFFTQTIHALGSGEDVKISERLNLSKSKIRGFERGKIGPKDGDDHIGGNYTAALNFEASLPNLLPEAAKTDVGLFWHNANVWGVDYDSTLGESSTIRSSLGVAASVYTPIGPLSLTWAIPVSKADTDKTETFSFQLGTSF